LKNWRDLQRLHTGLDKIGAGQYRHDARHGARGGGVDRDDPSVGMRGAKKGERRLPWEREIVGEAAGPSQQALVLDSPYFAAAAETPDRR
jgi:hypothetical protein